MYFQCKFEISRAIIKGKKTLQKGFELLSWDFETILGDPKDPAQNDPIPNFPCCTCGGQSSPFENEPMY